MAVSLHEQLMDAVLSVLAGLNLSGVACYKLKFPDPEQATFPAIFVSLEGCRPEMGPIDTENDQKILPVAVHLMDRSDWRDQSGLSPWLTNYELVTSALLMQVCTGQGALPPVAGNWDNEIRPMAVLEQQKALGPAYQNAVASFLFRTKSITPRKRT